MKDALHVEGIGLGWLMTGITHYFGNEGVIKINDAISRTRGAGVPWLAILQVLLPLIASLLSGGTLNLQVIIDAILALIGQQPKPKTV